MMEIFITNKIFENGIEILKKAGVKIEINDTGKPLTKAQLKEIFLKYDGVISSVSDKIDEEIIQAASSDLKIISNYAVGIDNIDVLAAKRKGIVVTNTPGVAGEAVAEHTFALILACSKSLVEADKFMRSGKYHRWDSELFVSPQMWGKTIGIIGLGRIGTYVGHIAYGGFKMNVLYHDLHRAEDFEMLTESKFSTIDNIIKKSDIITLHVPLTSSTKHLIGRDQLKSMKSNVILINTARGPIIDEKALVWALKENKIAAAGLDVFEHEPEISQELIRLENVILTPHTASASTECREAMARIAAQNVLDVFEGNKPFGLVEVE